MIQRPSLRATTRLLAAALVISPLLAACAGGSGVKKDTRYVARDVNTLYRAAQDRLDRKQYKVAAALFDEVERQHPYSPWALISGAGSRLQTWVRPRTSRRISPAASSTLICLDAAASDIAKGSASSPTVRSPTASSPSIWRRVVSPSAWKIVSRLCESCSTMWFNIDESDFIVNHMVE